VDNAPVFKTWKFTAFITSKETIEKRINKLDQPFIVQDINLKEDKLKSIPITLKKYVKKQTIHIHLKNHTICCSTKTLHQSIFFILEKLPRNTILFENIYLVQLPQRPGEQKVLIRLFELQEYLNSFNLKQK
jgi:hypothetical protein